MDNDHGLVAQSSRVSPYSTLFLISKLGIMIVPSIEFWALVDTTHVTIKQKDQILVMYSHHHGTVMCLSFYAGCPTFTSPAAHLMHAHMLATSARSSTHFHWI